MSKIKIKPGDIIIDTKTGVTAQVVTGKGNDGKFSALIYDKKGKCIPTITTIPEEDIVNKKKQDQLVNKLNKTLNQTWKSVLNTPNSPKLKSIKNKSPTKKNNVRIHHINGRKYTITSANHKGNPHIRMGRPRTRRGGRRRRIKTKKKRKRRKKTRRKRKKRRRKTRR